jgi:hypothetical protein
MSKLETKIYKEKKRRREMRNSKHLIFVVLLLSAFVLMSYAQESQTTKMLTSNPGELSASPDKLYGQ